MGIGDHWGTREELLHPRGWHGRFIRKAKMSEAVANALQKILGAFAPATFPNDAAAAQYTRRIAKPGGFGSGLHAGRFKADYSSAQEDLRDGIPDNPETKKFVAMMDQSKVDLPDDLILSRVVPITAFGMTEQQAADPEHGLQGLIGHVLADRSYGSMNVGTPLQGPPGTVTIVQATPKGTKAIIPTPANGGGDREIIMDRGQPFRITKVTQKPGGGYYVSVVAAPNDNSDLGAIPEPGGATVPRARISNEERAARVEAMRVAGAKRMKAGAAEQSDAELEQRRLEAQGPQPDQTQVNPAHVLPTQQPVPGAPIPGQEHPDSGKPSPVGPAVPPSPGAPPARQEPTVTESAGANTPRSAAPAGAPQAPAPTPTTEPTPQAPEETPSPTPLPNTPASFRNAVREQQLQAPVDSGARTSFNKAFADLTSGKRHPEDVIRDLDAELEHYQHRSGTLQEGEGQRLQQDVQRLKALRNAASEHFGLGRKEEAGAPAAPEVPSAPEAPSAEPVKKAARKAPAKKATEFHQRPVTRTPEEQRSSDDAVLRRAASLPATPRNEEEQRIKDHAERIKAERAGTAAPAKKAAKKAAAPAVKKAAPAKAPAAKKAAPAAPTEPESKRAMPPAKKVAAKAPPVEVAAKAAAPPAKKVAPAKVAPKAFDAKALADTLRSRDQDDVPTLSREEGMQALEGLNKTQLVELAREMQATPGDPKRLNMDNLQRQIVDHAIGRRLDSIAIRGFTGDRPEQPGKSIRKAAPSGGPSGATSAPAELNGTITDLRRIAQEEGVDLKGKRLKGDIRKAIEDHRAGNAPAVPAKKAAEKAAPAKALHPAVSSPEGQRSTQLSGGRADQALTPDRREQFTDGWTDSVGQLPGGAGGRSLQEVHDDVASGKITPQEAIRRVESDISLDGDELRDVERELRSAQAEDRTEDVKRLDADRKRLNENLRAADKASKFLRDHFKSGGGDEPTAKQILSPGDRKKVQGLSVEEAKASVKAWGLGDIQGNTSEEVFDNAVKEMMRRGPDERRRVLGEAVKGAIARPAKVAKPKADAPQVRDLATGIDVPERVLEMAQKDLNDGKSTEDVAKKIEEMRLSPASPHNQIKALRAGGYDHQEEHQEGIARLQKQADAMDQFIARLRGTDRTKATAMKEGAAPKLTPEDNKQASDIADLMDVPKEQVQEAIQSKKAATEAPSDAAKGTLDLIRTARTDSEFHDLMKGKRKPELIAIAKAAGMNPGPRTTNAELVKMIREGEFTDRTGLSPEDTPASLLRRGVGVAPKVDAETGRLATERRENIARTLAESEYLRTQGASARATKQRIMAEAKDSLSPGDRTELMGANSEAAVERIAREHGLTRTTPRSGATTAFNPGVHEGPEGILPGDPVVIDRPGFGRVVPDPEKPGKETTQGVIKAKVRRAEGTPPTPPAKKTAKKAAPSNVTQLPTRGAGPAAPERATSATVTPIGTKAQRVEAIRAREAAATTPVKAAAPTKAAKKAAPAKAASNVTPIKAAKKAAPEKPATVTPTKKAAPEPPAKKVAPPAKAAPAEVSQRSDKPLIKNSYGSTGGEVNFHEDGAIGLALQSMNDDEKHISIDGEPLYNVVGRLVTRSVRDRDNPEAIEDLAADVRKVIAKMPEGPAKKRLTDAVDDVTERAGGRATPTIPDSAPAALRHLQRDLRKIPLADQGRRGDPDFRSELQRLDDLMKDIEAGKVSAVGLDSDLRQRLGNKRHESQEGYYQIQAAVDRAAKALQEANKNRSITNWVRGFRGQAPVAAPKGAGPTEGQRERATHLLDTIGRMTVPELRKAVAGLGVQGTDTMGKNQLIDELEKLTQFGVITYALRLPRKPAETTRA